MIDYIRYWSDKTQIKVNRMVRWIGIPRSKYYQWKDRYGRVNEHNRWIPRDFWLTSQEQQAIIDYYLEHPREGYRRLTYMMMDEDIVAASPSSVYRVLKQAGLLEAWIVEQADRRVLKGETVPADEKLYSLFEAHNELLKRGKAGKPIEFNHKVLFAQTCEKFIHHYRVLEHRIEDKDLLEPALDAHKALFGDYPDLLAADKGFYESMDQINTLEKEIETVSIAKKGGRTPEEYDRETTDDFLAGQRFRAGS